MGDSIVYHAGMEQPIEHEVFSSRQMLYIQDQNSGVFSSGQIQFDGASLSNNSAYLNWSEGYFAIPYVITAHSTKNFGSAKSFLSALKNGSFQIINSMDVQIGGTTVVNTTPYLNEICHYKLMNSFNENDVKTLGDTLLFHPDTARSVEFKGASTKDVIKGLNNSFVDATALAETLTPTGIYSSSKSNIGLAKRMLAGNYDPANAALSGLVDESSVKSTLRNFSKLETGDKDQVYYIMCIIRLKDLHDLFAKLDIVKGVYARITLNVNQGSATIGVAHTSGVLSLSNVSITGNTFPVQFNAGAGLTLTGAADDVITLSCGVGQAGGFKHSQSSCRLYVPAYKMRPEAEAKFLAAGTTKTITYEDFQQFQVADIPPSGTINSIITNGMSNPTRLVVCPHLNTTANATTDSAGNALGINPLLSPFCSEPATTSPVVLSDINILLAGQNIFNTTQQYSFEHFLEGLRRESTLNGGLTDGVSSGLIGEADWNTAYRYHVFNLLRRSAETRDVPLSVQIQARSQCKVACDLRCFIGFERQLKIDTTTGMIV